jgi:ABC-type lipoprotein release transport system permease subunit
VKVILYIASRYLFFKNKRQAINLLSLITMFAMACGSGALIIILSTFNGFENLSMSLQESFQPDLTVSPKKNKQFEPSEELYQQLKAHPNIEATSLVYEDKVYVKYMGKDILATMKGVDASYFQTNEVKDYIIAGDTVLENEEYSFALIGLGLAQKLDINLHNQFEQLELFSPKSSSAGGSMTDNFDRSYIIPGGIFSVYQDYDDKYILAPLSFVQYLKSASENQVTALELKIKNPSITSTKEDIKSIVGDGFYVKNKRELNETFYKISQIEKLVTFFILVFVLAILSFNFIGSLTMHIIEKEEDIRMLHYLGLKSNQIFSLYMFYGIFQGLLGGIIGLIFGLVICAVQFTFGIVSMPGSGTFVVHSYPVMIYGSDIAYILGIIFTVSALASVFPALRAKNSIAVNQK